MICNRGWYDCRRGGDRRRGRTFELHQEPNAWNRREQDVLDGIHLLLSLEPNTEFIRSPGFGMSYTIFGLSTVSVSGTTRLLAPDIAFLIPLRTFRVALSSFGSSVVSSITAVRRPAPIWASCVFVFENILRNLSIIPGGASVFVPTVQNLG